MGQCINRCWGTIGSMLRMTPISAGMAGVEYLLRAAGCAEHDHARHTREATSKGAEYLLSGKEHGEAEGVWHGDGLAMLGVSSDAPVTADQMRAIFGRLEHPETGESLGRRPKSFASFEDRLKAALAAEPTASEERIAQITRDVKAAPGQGRSYYDLTYSPVKSVSVLKAALDAAGQHELADKVVAAHNQAVRESLRLIQDEVTTTRVGRHATVVQSDGTRKTIGEFGRTRGLVMTEWRHSSSREGDPHMHTHVAVLNRTMCEDGQIRAVDGKQFKALKGRADMLYERRLEQLITEATGARFALRPDGKTREILGVSRELCEQSSARSAAITAKVNEKIGAYRQAHGREPGQHLLREMHREAWATTRPAKSVLSPEALAERYARKHGAQTLLDQVEAVQAAARRCAEVGHPDARERLTEDELIVQAVERTQRLNASFDETLLALELHKVLGEVAWGGDTRTEMQRLLARALDPEGPAQVMRLAGRNRLTVPTVLRVGGDPNGEPIYRAANGERYATRAHMSAEQILLSEADMVGVSPQLRLDQVDRLMPELERSGLGADQRNAVLGIMTSGRGADVLVGPAGTGKSFTVATLDEVWRREFDAPVMGVATSQRATDVLAEEGLSALNTADFLTQFRPRADRQHRVLPRGTALVVDEAGMADTDKLAEIAGLVRAAGGKMIYTGDDAQLSAVGQGGMMRLIARDQSPYHLETVRRFSAKWERDASLRLRAGENDALDEYARHGRFRGGDEDAMTEAAVRGYMADLLEGRESVLIVRDNAQAAELSQRVRAQMVALGHVDAEVLADLRDDSPIGIGDQIQARKNERDIDSSDGRMLVNRELLTVEGIDERGRLLTRRASSGATVAMPLTYVAEHVTLAYAATVHAVQGRTVDTAHSLVDRSMDRNAFYVQMTRGRIGNYSYVVTDRTADEHELEGYSLRPADVLGEVLERDGAQISATETYRARLESADSLEEVGQVWGMVTRDAMADKHHDLLLAQLGADRVEWMSREEAHAGLMAALQHAEMSGHDVERLVRSAIVRDNAERRGLDDAVSMSAVLRSRVDDLIAAGGERPVPTSWVQRTRAVAGRISKYAGELAAELDRRVEMIGRAATMAPPDWALHEIGPMPRAGIGGTERRELWRSRVEAVGAYRELAGISDDQMGIGPAPSRVHDPVAHIAWTRAWEALGRPSETADHQSATVEQLQARVRRWEQEQLWAPVWVEGELEKATTLAEEFRREAATARHLLAAELRDRAGAETPEIEAQKAEVERCEETHAHYVEASERLAREAAGAGPSMLAERYERESHAAAAAAAAAEADVQAAHARLEDVLIAAAGGESGDAARLRAEAERAERLADRFDAAEQRYERLHEVRSEWAAHTREQAEEARLAAAELDRRGAWVQTQPVVPGVDSGDEQLAMLGEQGLGNTEYARTAAAEWEAGALEGELLPADEPVWRPAQLDVGIQDAEIVEDEPVTEVEAESVSGGQGEIDDQQIVRGVDADDEPGLDQAQPTTEVAPESEVEVEVEDQEVLEGELLPAEPIQVDEAEAEVNNLDIVDAEIVEDVSWDEIDRQRAAAEAKEAEAATAAADEKAREAEQAGRGDYGTEFLLDEVQEVDDQYPAPAEADEQQVALFDVTAAAEDRVATGQVREDEQLTVQQAEIRARLAEETMRAREERAERELVQRQERAEREERERAERDRREGRERDAERAREAADRSREAAEAAGAELFL